MLHSLGHYQLNLLANFKIIRKDIPIAEVDPDDEENTLFIYQVDPSRAHSLVSMVSQEGSTLSYPRVLYYSECPSLSQLE